MYAPWRREQLPPLAVWVDTNSAAMDLLVEGSRRSRFYTPFKPPKDGAKQLLLELIQFDSVSRGRAVARALTIRAMLQLGEGRYDDAWQDLLATHRWARLVGQGPTVVEQFVAVAIDSNAATGTKALLAEPLDSELARQIQADLRTLGPASDMARSFDEGERLAL